MHTLHPNFRVCIQRTPQKCDNECTLTLVSVPCAYILVKMLLRRFLALTKVACSVWELNLLISYMIRNGINRPLTA